MRRANRMLVGGLCAAGALLAFGSTNAVANWVQPVAGPLNANPSHDAQNPRLASIGGIPYVAWHESNGSTYDARVARLTGGSWAAVGSPLASNSSQPTNRYPAIANVGGTPFLAWMELVSARNQIEVSQFSGSSWNAAGGSLNVDPIQHAESPTIVGMGNVPYVAWDEYNAVTGSEQAHVARFNGSSWVAVGGALNSNPNLGAFNPAIAVIHGVLVVAWQEFVGPNYQVHVASFNGSSWVPVGGVVNIDPNASAEIPSIVGVRGVPWITWDEDNGTAHLVHVARFNGSSWQVVGGALNLNSQEGGFEADIAGINGVPWVAWRDQATGVPQVHVVKLKGGSTWTEVGGALNIDPGHDARTPSIINSGEEPWVAWQEKNNGVYQIRVKRFVNPPDTRIFSTQASPKQGTVTFKFRALGQATGFQCRLLSQNHTPSFTSCHSPRSYRGLTRGRYTFEVRAVGPGGTDSSPAERIIGISRVD